MDNNMNELFDRKMGEGSLDDLVPGYEREAGWQMLQPRLQQKKRPVIVWWAYAAAMLIGGIGGALLMYRQDAGRDMEHTAVVNAPITEPVKPQATTKYVHDTVLVYKERTVVKEERMVAVKKPAQQQIQKAILPAPTIHDDQQTQIAQQPQPTMQEPKKMEQQEAPAVANNNTLPVIHLLDIDNEDRQYMTGGVKQVPTSTNMVLRISPSRLPDRNSDNNGPLFRNFHK